MKNIDLRKILSENSEGKFDRLPSAVRNAVFGFLDKLLRVSEFNDFLAAHPDTKNFDLIEEFFSELDFSYYVSEKDKKRIPSEGRLIIVSNHPLGGLDGLSLLQAVGEVRRDVKIVANGVLTNIENLDELFLPIEIFSAKAQRTGLEAIEKALSNEEVVIFFPAGEVSRMSWKGLREKRWQKGAVRMAAKMNAPILPIFVKARNSNLFYAVSALYKKLSTFMLPRELFGQRRKTIGIKIGDPIPYSVFKSGIVNPAKQTKLLKKHVGNIGKGRGTILKTEKTVIHPVNRNILRNEIKRAPVLNFAPGDKRVVLVDYDTCPAVIKEISRLREITFRKAGEGTGKKRDTDIYDRYYKHIVLWDGEEREIIGAYRLGVCSEIIDRKGVEGIYNSELFRFSPDFVPVLRRSIELGRSFILQKYWKSNALDLIWKGIGAFLNSYYPEIEYFFGAVSISNNYPEEVKSLIVSYYKKWYASDQDYAQAKNPFVTGTLDTMKAASLFTGKTHTEDFKTLKNTLKITGHAVPVLLRTYADLAEFGACSYLDFGVDPGFADSIDALVLVDLKQMTPTKKERYLGITEESENLVSEKDEL